MTSILMLLDNAFKPDVRVQKEINTLLSLGCEIDLFCWDKGSNLPEHSVSDKLAITRIRVPAKSQQGLKQITNLLKFYREFKKRFKTNLKHYDLVYAHDFLMLPLGVYIKNIRKIQLVYDAHEIYHLMEWEKYNSIIRKFIQVTEQYYIRYADHFIVVNQIRKDYYSAYIKKNIIVLGNWFDPYKGTYISLRQIYNIPENDLLFVYFGTLSRKGRELDYMIENIVRIPNAHLVFAGVGHDAKYVDEKAGQLDRIYSLGWENDVRKYLSDVDFSFYFLNDGRKYYHYAAPNTLYQAISHGIPIISNVPGEPENLIKKFNIGYFVSTGNSLENQIDILKNSVNNLEKRSNIKKIQEDFNWSVASGEVYSRILKTL
jgi:glycosyltransferase involved in cell wall biosynthesis